MSDMIKYLGNEIKRLRKEANLSQESLATLSDVERAQISKIESGAVSGVTLNTIKKILDVFGYKLELSKKDTIEESIHPFIKWAGGKTQLIDTIKKHLPEKYNRYFEPFVGGGALFLELKPKTFSINDVNDELMCAFKCFQNNELYCELIETLKKYDENHSEEQYYEVRNLDRSDEYKNFNSAQKAARFIYLNKACFNGLYRVNSNGYFNVPSGKKSRVKSFDKENFTSLKNFFSARTGSITCVDFEKSVENAKEGDFVYFDPPYDSYEGKSTFTSYSKDNFGKDEQIRLSQVFKKLASKGVFVMLSNHNTPLINELYRDFHINVVEARRNINSKGDGRGFVEEVLITNYE